MDWSIGVDVSKRQLDACALRDDKRVEKHFANSAKGISNLLAWAVGLGQVRVIGMESTGGYELDLAIASFAAGFVTSVENPRKIKNFAGAKNCLNKTDRADARIIAEFLKVMGFSTWRLADPLIREISLLTRHRATLIAECNRMGNRLEHRAHLPELVVRQLEETLAKAQANLKEVEKARLDLVKQSPTMMAEMKALTKISGISTVTALLILSEAGDVDQFMYASSYAAFSGMSPCRRESGNWRGRTGISKCGNPRIRGGLTMPGMAAIRFNPVIKAFRDRLLANGKTKMQALIACMRKLLMICFGVLKALRNGKTPYYGFKENLALCA
jgi:transposase